jgi:pseudouridine synthase
MRVPDQGKPERIQKILARAGIASRRAAEKLILDGRVELEGKPARLGDKAIPGTDDISVDGVIVETGVPLKYFILNKPRGVVSTADDPQGRPTVMEYLPEEVRRDYRLFPVGRLDMDSSGLIFLTNDGLLANRLIHPSFEVTREYRVEVEPEPRDIDLARLRKGVELEDGNTGQARVSLRDRAGRRAIVGMKLHTGKKRQIRRSFEHLGFKVHSLHRVRIGSIGLGALRPGDCRELDPREIKTLYGETGFRV